MFVKTENHGIINLNCFPRIDVIEYDGAWLLKAFIQMDMNKAEFFEGSTRGPGPLLAKFNKEVQAKYSFCHLYSALEAGLSVWDPHAVESFSGLWSNAKKELSSIDPRNRTFVDLETLKLLELKITGLREITINFYEPVRENERGNIENKIKNTLKAVDPMQETVWKVDWKDIEDEIPAVHV